ncbi:uncharacterized protein EI97DRAFT_368355 [Westerdykella ornata]|uniref:Fms interacting protein n=1 Tax=Westerdykella ornata TaxID=318751 RepID=A0A6A6JWI7_WESOR|nr:uncharacterized protein EI97DRAFT_368355 [Westerdykella ornata]KAF2280980.1 hypothetical protein EI97DRAFT_368355 [Westerdykella ornata]
MAVESPATASNGHQALAAIPQTNFESHFQTAHNLRLYQENQKLKQKVNDLVEYQLANPKVENPTSRAAIDREKQIMDQIEIKQKAIGAQLAVIRTLFRQSVMKVRGEKARTAESRNVNDALILQLHNLKYEEQSLASEISAAQNFDHKYTKLPLIPVEEFLELFPDHANSSEDDLMKARIQHEKAAREKLEDERRHKLKQKQALIAEVQKRKEGLTKLDKMLEDFIGQAAPIREMLME